MINLRMQKKEDEIDGVFSWCIPFVLIAIIIAVTLTNCTSNKNDASDEQKQEVVIPPVVEPEIPDPPEPPAPCPGPCPCHKNLPPPCDPVKVLAFTASWCKPCQEAKPKLQEAVRRGLNVQIYDIDSDRSSANSHNITKVPTFIVYRGGREVSRSNNISDVTSLLN